MIESSVPYIFHTKLFLQRFSDPGAQLHRFAEPQSWNDKAGALRQMRDAYGRPCARALWQADACRGVALAVGINPFSVAGGHYVTGVGQGHATNPHLRLRNIYRFDAAAQQSRIAADEYENAKNRSSLRERGTGGALVDTAFITTGTPAFALGKLVGNLLGAPLWVGGRLAHLVGLLHGTPPTLSGTLATSGQVVGAILGLLAGVAAAIAPWFTLAVVPRLLAGLLETSIGAVGGLLFGLFGLRHFACRQGPPRDWPATLPACCAAEPAPA